jgi:hypothetical protein
MARPAVIDYRAVLQDEPLPGPWSGPSRGQQNDDQLLDDGGRALPLAAALAFCIVFWAGFASAVWALAI